MTARATKTAAIKASQQYIQLMEAADLYIAEERPKIESPAEAVKFMRPLIQRLDQEEFWVISLDTKNHILRKQQITKGLVDRTDIHAREVFRQAIIDNASRIIVFHNHPSGDPTPSSQDIACIRTLIAAGKIIGIEVIDSVVMGYKTPQRSKDFVSFREDNLM